MASTNWRQLVGVLLIGCCGASCAPQLADFEPYVPADSVSDPAALAHDRDTCRSRAAALPQPSLLPGMAQAAGVGVAGNIQSAPLNVWVPVLGGAGGAAQAALQTLGLSQSDKLKAYTLCLHDLGQHSGAYMVLDGNLFH